MSSPNNPWSGPGIGLALARDRWSVGPAGGAKEQSAPPARTQFEYSGKSVLNGQDRVVLGNTGDAAPVGEGVSEMRIHYGPGYRVYFMQRGHTLIVLLAGGDKRTQGQDIETALKLARELEDS